MWVQRVVKGEGREFDRRGNSGKDFGACLPIRAAQELAELDTALAAITRAGVWKSTRMPLQYAEKINAARAGMARAAAATGRDEAVSE